MLNKTLNRTDLLLLNLIKTKLILTTLMERWHMCCGRNRLILAVIRVSLLECVPPCSAWEDVLLGSCLAVTVCDIRGLDRGMRSTECHF